MHQSNKHPEKLRRRVIALFFSGLVVMAFAALGIGWLCRDWGAVRLGLVGQIFGLCLLVSGLALVIWTVQIQYRLGDGTPAPRVATRWLVTTGPYAHSRNPMTLGALLLYLGLGIWMGSLVVVSLVVLVFSGLLSYIYFHETRELAGRFGQEYLEYKQNTPFLLPRCRLRSRE